MRVVLGVVLVGLVVCVGCGPSSAPRRIEILVAGEYPDEFETVEVFVGPQEEEAIAAIMALGGRFKINEKNDVATVILAFNTTVTDADLVHLKGLPKLNRAYLRETKVTDAGLVHLKGMTNLQTLNLCNTKVTDAGLVHLKGLTKLNSLNLWGTKVTDAGVKKLKQALPNCRIDSH